MKDTPKSILQGVTLLATVLAMTGHAEANSRFGFLDTKFKTPHTVQDAVERKVPHTVQDHFKIPDDELPRDDDKVEEWNLRQATFLLRFGGDERIGPADLSLNSWAEPVVDAGSGPAFDPIALPAAAPLEFHLRAPGDEPGAHSLVPVAGAQVPGPGALPLLGLGTLALFGRRRRS